MKGPVGAGSGLVVGCLPSMHEATGWISLSQPKNLVGDVQGFRVCRVGSGGSLRVIKMIRCALGKDRIQQNRGWASSRDWGARGRLSQESRRNNADPPPAVTANPRTMSRVRGWLGSGREPVDPGCSVAVWRVLLAPRAAFTSCLAEVPSIISSPPSSASGWGLPGSLMSTYLSLEPDPAGPSVRR